MLKLNYCMKTAKTKTKKQNKKPSSKLNTKMNMSIRRYRESDVARKVTFVGIVISSLMVVMSIVVSVFFNDEAVAKRKFEYLAKDYYENYYYERFMETISDEVFDAKMTTFSNTGLQPVTLRQLLLYQNGKNSEYKKYFDKKGFSCDKNSTTAQFFPVEPYGKKDYKVEFNYSCQTE